MTAATRNATPLRCPRCGWVVRDRAPWAAGGLAARTCPRCLHVARTEVRLVRLELRGGRRPRRGGHA